MLMPIVMMIDSCFVKILNFVESRMSVIAPNVSVLCGSRIASRLVGMAGGLEVLAKIPACNIRVRDAISLISLIHHPHLHPQPHLHLHLHLHLHPHLHPPSLSPPPSRFSVPNVRRN